MLTKSFLKISLLCVNFEKFTSLNEGCDQSQVSVCWAAIGRGPRFSNRWLSERMTIERLVGCYWSWSSLQHQVAVRAHDNWAFGGLLLVVVLASASGGCKRLRAHDNWAFGGLLLVTVLASASGSCKSTWQLSIWWAAIGRGPRFSIRWL